MNDERIRSLATNISELNWAEMIFLARELRDMISDDTDFDATSIDAYAWKLNGWAEGYLETD